MSSSDDTATLSGATNVALNQRAASAPYRREEVNIQGDENAGKAIGFDAEGRLTTLVIYEDSFATVDTEAQFDAALAAGRSLVLRGEGTGGVIPLTTPKVINSRFTEIKSDTGAVLSFTPALQGFALNLRRGITVHADDVTLRNFELTAQEPVATNNCYGLAFSEGNEDHGHRMKVLDMHIHGWMRCISKDGSAATTAHDDVLIDRCYLHTFNQQGLWLEYGMRRLNMRNTRVIGKIGSENHSTHNAMRGGTGWEDCVVENCLFSNVDRIGIELTIADYTYYHQRSRLTGCRSENCGSMGFSTMFGEGLIIEKCVAKNVKWIGFEIGGDSPESASPSLVNRYGQGILDSCEVDGVDSEGLAGDKGSGQGIGISIDGARDTVVRGSTRISNITSTMAADAAGGIVIADSERCSVRGAVLENCGHHYILAIRGLGPNTRGYHEIIGNTFRNAAGSGTHQAVFIADTTAEVSRNMAWQKTGTTLRFQCQTAAGAAATCDGVVQPHGGPQTFTGSNIICPSGA